MSEDVLLETRGAVGLATLNRPKALNALSLEMCHALHPRLDTWAADPSVKAVVIRGAGGRAFCAGGDVRAVAGSVARSDLSLSREFFRAEYALNHRIHHFPKPFIALVDGICMGGGLGLSVHGAFRAVTEKLVLAMPETAIGIFPDVGGGWFLPRFPGETGTYLGLTGARCDAADALWSGYATHRVESSRLEDVVDALASADWSGPGRDVAARVLQGFHQEPSASALAARADVIARCFQGNRVEDLLAALEREGTAWAEETRATLLRMSPTSLRVTLRQLRIGRGQDYDATARMEYRLSQALTQRPDFQEGIRAVLVDKDQKPRWSPATLAEVTDAEVEACFAPRPGDELELPARS
ncbi:enoyl-CoA hydratase/isomerase family protein [Corallococcus aberystwythensis]|uniref:3-hydroxyisobutyryl-CoA hydrolase n=1 Tax=Corallococcus aberystwythensis TaxID=2316722 RepID=A0A3A8PS77_9BACT|nr:enoyl-CoA hydratase/isomerase family protein [Corallococcus aberystwythensis]RKH54364.1 enoyl-CoA hydratase/isomerase family protein [Corallococcus aberystwythensis]